MNYSVSSFQRLGSSRIAIVLMLFGSGCGYAEYEMRLNESRKYYAYLDRVEQALAPKWVAPGNLMELRVPRQFIPIPPPQPVKNEDGGVELPAIDPRQPDYMNVVFPELHGAWEAEFKVAKPNGTAEDKKGYIYALCNYWELAGDHVADAGEFFSNLKTMLSEKLRIQVADERTEVHPKVVPAYRPQLTYEACAFKGKDIDGTNYTFELYSRTQGSVIGVIVIVLPEGMENPQKVSERIPMMLENFDFTSVPPKAGADKNAAPAQAKPAVNF